MAPTPNVIYRSEEASIAQVELDNWQERLERGMEDEELPVYWANRVMNYLGGHRTITVGRQQALEGEEAVD